MSRGTISPYFPFRRIKIIKQAVNHTADRAHIDLAPDQRFQPICHQCGQRVPAINSWTQRSVRDLNLASTQIWLRCAYRKLFVPIANASVSRNWSFFTRNYGLPGDWQRISISSAR